MKISYTVTSFIIVFLINVSIEASPPRYQLTTLNYIYYRMNLGASCKPVSVHTPVTYHGFSY